MAPMLNANNGVSNGAHSVRKLHKDSDAVGAASVDQVNLAQPELDTSAEHLDSAAK